jgi:putative MATE family efflux protein
MSLIARCIGAKNKGGADNAAMHSLILTLAVSVVATIILLLFLQNILFLMGAGVTVGLATEYGQIVFGGLIFLIFSNVASGILRAEGDVNRPMYAIAATTVLNIILDPIFIYYFGWGVSGAAWATIISSAISCVFMIYWLLLKRDTYVSFSRKDFKASWNVIKNILMVALPASVESLIMSILGIILNLMLVITGGAEAVAVYTAGWRVLMMAMIPPIGIGTAAITVGGAAYGSRNYGNLSTALSYSAKLGVGIAVVTATVSYVFAGNIATIFTYSPESAFMAPSIAAFLQVMFLFYLTAPLGITASSIFQGMGKGFTSLILTILRELILIALFAYLFAFILGFGSPGVWWGIVVGGGLGCAIAYIWATIYVRRLKMNY